jgi:hypothetical protein
MKPSETIEGVYDAWISNGGAKAGGKRKCGLLVVKSKPTLAPDVEVENRLGALLADVAVDSTTTTTRSSYDGDGGDNDGGDGKAVIGNMMLREHFRNLTLSLMRPFCRKLNPSNGVNENKNLYNGSCYSSSYYCGTTTSSSSSTNSSSCMLEEEILEESADDIDEDVDVLVKNFVCLVKNESLLPPHARMHAHLCRSPHTVDVSVE